MFRIRLYNLFYVSIVIFIYISYITQNLKGISQHKISASRLVIYLN